MTKLKVAILERRRRRVLTPYTQVSGRAQIAKLAKCFPRVRSESTKEYLAGIRSRWRQYGGDSQVVESSRLIERNTVIFRPFYYFDRGCAAYLFGCGTLSRCAVVDPRADDIDSYVSFATEKNMRITHVIDTHVHADHRSGGPELARRLDVPYCLHESADFSGPFTRLKDGDDIELGNTRVEVIHTPGHSTDSVCLLATDLKRGTDPWFVLTGDTLFVGAVGRPDLPGRTRENAAELFASIHEKLLTLPDELEVYPGHFSGSVCGAGLSGKPMSTIGFERRWNPMLTRDRQSFIDALADVPPKPTDMEQIMAFNHGRAETKAPA